MSSGTTTTSPPSSSSSLPPPGREGGSEPPPSGSEEGDNHKKKKTISVLELPGELQVHILTFLRAYDLSAVQATCRFYHNPELVNKVVHHMKDHVYTPELTKGIIGSTSTVSTATPKFTLEHLRNMELVVVARVLSLPEPKAGFYVSKSWIKKTLLWLEEQEVAVGKIGGPSPTKKKLTKKQQRQRNRRLSDVGPPWPNINSDILCAHQNLACCGGTKSARSKRRLLDKQAWKILKKLYPDSTQLSSVQGECLQCVVETETAKKNELDRIEQAKVERKKPLDNFHVRRFYTRTKGVPTHCIRDVNVDNTGGCGCPLSEGKYYLIPRVWCHQWRRYIKTGEGGNKNLGPPSPEATTLLCDAHRLPLLPPHLEEYLGGTTVQLLSTTRRSIESPSPLSSPTTPSTTTPVGIRPDMDPATVSALMAAGISYQDIMAQHMAMLNVEQQVAPPVITSRSSSSLSDKDLLDRENHVVVELVTDAEWKALQDTGCWPRSSVINYAVSVDVTACGSVQYSTLPCRKCDASARSSSTDLLTPSKKNHHRSSRGSNRSTPEHNNRARSSVSSLEY